MSYPNGVIMGFIVCAMVFGAVAMANGDVLQTRDQLRDKTCIAADQNPRPSTRDCDEVCVPEGDGIPDQIRDQLKLHDGTCIAADQIRDQLKLKLHDGTCIAADQIRDQLKLKLQDGSCV